MEAFITAPGKISGVEVNTVGHPPTPAVRDSFWRMIHSELRAGKDVEINNGPSFNRDPRWTYRDRSSVTHHSREYAQQDHGK
jgi:hypothetical protein